MDQIQKGRTMKIEKENVGDAFQSLTKYDRGELPKGGLDMAARPEHYKVYKTPISALDLPVPEHKGGGALWELMAKRRTRRTYKLEPLTLAELSQLLWAANGKTKEGRDAVLRSAPSAGALYPIELYVMANNVEGLEKGIYHYDVPGHRLLMIKEGDYSEDATAAALGQTSLAKSGAVIFLSAVLERSRWKYKQRAYRYVYLDAGHIGQNVCLAAESLGLGTCPIGAFYDEEFDGILGIDGTDETAVYAFTVGR